jgi:hypothetical protein
MPMKPEYGAEVGLKFSGQVSDMPGGSIPYLIPIPLKIPLLSEGCHHISCHPPTSNRRRAPHPSGSVVTGERAGASLAKCRLSSSFIV